MADSFGKAIPHFLSNVLSTPAGALPKGAQWVVAFEDLAGILPAIKLAMKYEGRSSSDWKIPETALNNVISPGFQETVGCVFCHAVDMPGDSLVVNPEGNIMSNAFLRSYVGQGRNQFPQLRMTFLNTNLSFAENFLRPWVLATGQFGLIARSKVNDPSRNYRTNAFLYKLGSYSMSEPPFILQKMTFYDICCISVSDEEHNYQVSNSPVYREAQFVYNYYSLDTSNGTSSGEASTGNAQLQNKEKLKIYNITNDNIATISKDTTTINGTTIEIDALRDTYARGIDGFAAKELTSYDKKFASATLKADKDYTQQLLSSSYSLSGSKFSESLNSYDKKFIEPVLQAYQKRNKRNSQTVNQGSYYLVSNPYVDPTTGEALTFLEYEKIAKQDSRVPSEYINPTNPYFDFETESYISLDLAAPLSKSRAEVPSILPPKDLPYFDLFSNKYLSFEDFEVLPKRQTRFGSKVNLNEKLTLNLENFTYQTNAQRKAFEKRQKQDKKAQDKQNESAESARNLTVKPIAETQTAFSKAEESLNNTQRLNRKQRKEINEFAKKANKIYGTQQAQRLTAQFTANLINQQNQTNTAVA